MSDRINVSLTFSFFFWYAIRKRKRLLQYVLQEQHIAEEMVAKAAAFRDGKDLMNEGQLLNKQQSRKQFSNPLPLLEMTPKVNYDYNQRRYNNPPNIGQAWSVGSFIST